MLSNENVDKDPKLKIIVKDEGPIGKRLMEAMFRKGSP